MGPTKSPEGQTYNFHYDFESLKKLCATFAVQYYINNTYRKYPNSLRGSISLNHNCISYVYLLKLKER